MATPTKKLFAEEEAPPPRTPGYGKPSPFRRKEPKFSTPDSKPGYGSMRSPPSSTGGKVDAVDKVAMRFLRGGGTPSELTAAVSRIAYVSPSPVE